MDQHDPMLPATPAHVVVPVGSSSSPFAGLRFEHELFYARDDKTRGTHPIH